MASHDDIARRWLDVLYGQVSASTGRRLENYSASSNMYGAGPVLYSYGSHFPLAEYYGAGEHGRDRALFLLNGDRFSNTTSRHQSVTRSAIGDGRRFGADVLLVPFSALDGARIERASIRPLEIRPDRWTETLEDVGEPDLDDTAGATCSRDETGYRDGDVSRIHTWRLDDGRRIERRETLSRCDIEYIGDDGRRLETPSRTVVTFEPGEKLATPYVLRPGASHGLECRRESDGRWYGVRRRHWLGDSVFMASVRDVSRRRRSVTVADVIDTALGDISADRFAERNGRARPMLRALDVLDTSAPIVETRPATRRRRFVSSFDNAEPGPLYYLATLPDSSRARTVADAEMDLAPAAVHAAIARGRDVRRQGDIFFVATSLSDGELEGMTRARARLTQWTRGARARAGEIGYVAPLDRHGRARAATWRRRRFADTFEVGTFGPRTPAGTRRDMRKRRREVGETLERCNATLRRAILAGDVRGARNARFAVDSARDRLATLERARTAHRDAYRGHNAIGAGYAVETWRRAHESTLDRFEPGARPLSDRWTRNRDRIRDTLQVHGTAHTASEVARATFGRVYVRGTVRHVPDLAGERRQRDHVNVLLGDGATWYLAVRNTVPRNRDGRA